MNTDRPTDINVSLASEEQRDEVRAVFDKALTRLFKEMNPERAQSFITNKEALSFAVKSLDFPLVINKAVFQIDHNISLKETLSCGAVEAAIEFDKVSDTMDLCPNHEATTVSIIKVFQNETLADINSRIHSIGYNTGCLRSVLFAGMHLVNIGQWVKNVKIITPYQISGKDFLCFVYEGIEGKFCRYRLSMKAFSANQVFQVDKYLFVGVKSPD
ncbi:MAG: hypothetical protein WC827_04800 [Candidatus Paceibacterota bacterium]|jgi:hypothetical protein